MPNGDLDNPSAANAPVSTEAVEASTSVAQASSEQPRDAQAATPQPANAPSAPNDEAMAEPADNAPVNESSDPSTLQNPDPVGVETEAESQSGGPSSVEEEPPADPALGAIDEALAREAESLLDADCKSVEEGLDDALEQDAAAVGPGTGEPAAVSDECAQSDVPASTPDAQAPAEVSTDQSVADPLSSQVEPGEPNVPEPPVPGPVDDEAPAPQAASATSARTEEPAASAEPHDAAEVAEQEPAEPPDNPPPPPQSNPQPATHAEGQTVASASAATTAGRPGPPAGAKATQAPQTTAGRTRTHAVWSAVEPHVVRLLRRVNSPLRRLPPAVRPAVDWIALSLVFWVPIVWLIALLVVGR